MCVLADCFFERRVVVGLTGYKMHVVSETDFCISPVLQSSDRSIGKNMEDDFGAQQALPGESENWLFTFQQGIA